MIKYKILGWCMEVGCLTPQPKFQDFEKKFTQDKTTKKKICFQTFSEFFTANIFEFTLINI